MSKSYQIDRPPILPAPFWKSRLQMPCVVVEDFDGEAFARFLANWFRH
jgi:hypothetical protein